MIFSRPDSGSQKSFSGKQVPRASANSNQAAIGSSKSTADDLCDDQDSKRIRQLIPPEDCTERGRRGAYDKRCEKVTGVCICFHELRKLS